MSFEDIPEDKREQYPCPECDNGNVELNNLWIWECDSCSFKKADARRTETSIPKEKSDE